MAEIDDEIKRLLEILEEDPTLIIHYGAEFEGFETVDELEGDSGRWTRFVHPIIKTPSGKHIRVTYEAGLTEYQDDTFDSWDPEEVVRTEKTVVVVSWDPISPASRKTTPTWGVASLPDV